MKRAEQPRKTLGWREWVALPDWGVEATKAKVDTGARTSAIHAFDIEMFNNDGAPWVRFAIHPWQQSDGDSIAVVAPLLEKRVITSSSGTQSERPVVLAKMVLAGVPIDAELTLAGRDEMGFRMLIGRQAMRKRFKVDPALSYLGGRPSLAVRRKNRGKAPKQPH
ncbi:MAG: hypothetical protein ACJA14_001472 [Ilumatobacter sp.]|jgi:hypothetical protein